MCWFKNIHHTFVNAGYFQTVSWLFAKPCADTNSLYVFDQRIAHTCELALTELIHWPLLQFQNLMVRSAVPPPLARILGCHGHQSNALTAAWCWLNRKAIIFFNHIFYFLNNLTYLKLCNGSDWYVAWPGKPLYMFNRLSFPPLAR